jgi:YD repeat-containing protein
VLQIRGTVNEAATVTVQGVEAAVSNAMAFQGGLPTTPGTNVFTVTATDGSGNTATAQYEVDAPDAPKAFSHDPNGNLTSDDARVFEWDARNQIVAVTVGSHRSEFTYDGLQRRVRVVERENGQVQSDRRLLWCETAVCDERDGTNVVRRVFDLGESLNGQAQFFVFDHVGSVREVSDAGGLLLARYEFDP